MQEQKRKIALQATFQREIEERQQNLLAQELNSFKEVQKSKQIVIEFSSDEEANNEDDDDVHAIDKFNTRDENGNVLVNTSEGNKDNYIYLAPQVGLKICVYYNKMERNIKISVGSLSEAPSNWGH